MRIDVDLDLEGLEEALREWLPRGVHPRSLRIAPESFRLEAEAPMIGRVTLTGRVRTRPGELVLSDFDLEGAGLAKGLVLSRLRDRLADLDQRGSRWHAWSESEGDRFHLEFGAG